MQATVIFFFILSLSPIRSFNDYELKWMLAQEIEKSTDDLRRQEVLARLAWFEGGYWMSVANCKVKGDKGQSHGLFQIKPRTPRERKMACGTLTEQIALANEFLDRSANACPQNSGADTLAMYVSGTCQKGIKQAKHRWGGPELALETNAKKPTAPSGAVGFSEP